VRNANTSPSSPHQAEPLATSPGSFGDIIANLTARLERKHLPPESARDLASLVVTTMEGALLLGTTLRSPEPFDTATLTANAHAAANSKWRQHPHTRRQSK
jgi:TetR/AcrR family transcriptional regulator, lmrAB and yxaGH operons repressor